jgi:diguanylate cyclase (GGDEF)-like protein/PAS domain S-box-containing protein/putative nucleotidyltransferase with HDIG domain
MHTARDTKEQIRVLLIDNDPAEAQQIRDTFSQPDADFIQLDYAAQLNEALERLRQRQADVILLDLAKPDFTGSHAIQTLHGVSPGVPIIVLMPEMNPSLVNAILHEGANECLPREGSAHALIAHVLRFALERKRCEELLRRSEMQYRDVFDGMADGIHVIDQDLRIVLMNKEFHRWLQRFELDTDPSGKYILEVFPFLDEAVIKEYKQVFVSGMTLATEETTVVGGVPFVTETRKIPVIHGGKTIQVMTVVHDITARKKSEEALRLSEAKFRSIFDGMNEIAVLHEVVYDERGTPVDYRILDCNLEFERVIGISRDQAIGKLGSKIFGTAEAPYLGIYSRVAKSRQPVSFDTYFLPMKKHLAISVFSPSPGHFATVTSDITERKAMENALTESERFLSGVIDSIKDGIVVLDPQLCIVRTNQVIEQWHSYALPLQGKKCYEVFHARTTPCEECPTLETLRTGKPSIVTVPRHGLKGKQNGWIEIYTFPFVDHITGSLKGVIEYVRDISVRKKMEAEKERLNQDLVESNNRLKQLSLRDPQTGLFNHRYLEEVIESEFQRARRYYHPLSLILLDIDYFKSVNELYGHKFGDKVLKQLAGLLKKMVRRYDAVIRYSGEEFVIMSPSVDRTTALTLAQRLLDAVNLYNFGDKKHAVKLKLSLAVSSFPDDRSLKGIDLINLAEQVLAKAKENGGNRVYSAADLAPHTGNGNGEKSTVNVASVREMRGKLEKLNKRANESLVEAILALSKTIELKDHYTGEHVERTVQYATGLARKLALPGEDVELVRQAAMLHDVGKIGIPEKILLKRAKLTPKEFEIIKRHPQIGADILRPIQQLHNLIPLVYYHHERWDGRGYVTGLKGEEIPLGARIIAVADVYQALTSDRPYRKAYPMQRAIQIIESGAGTQFDPRIVYVFMNIIRTKQ